jgi:hypothetical protein
VFLLSNPTTLWAKSNEDALLARIQALEARLKQLEGEKQALTAARPQDSVSQALLERLDALDQRLSDIEANAVLSEPETRVKQKEVWVDKNGNEYDEPGPGTKRVLTYQRERVFRRQTISEKIEGALADSDAKKVTLGVDASSITQGVFQTSGDPSPADGQTYQLASADLLFAARLAQYTTFFADVVGLSGTVPDTEVQGLTLLNGYSARLVRQNELDLREASIRTELFNQRLGLTFGRLDLTNFFDRNAAANDETTQFLSDALVNNPLLGLSSNGSGIAAVYDAKNGVNFRLGFQQSDSNATNLSDSLFTLAEVGYLARPFSLPEGNYRVWYRRDNTGDQNDAYGLSFDQKLKPGLTAFARYGSGDGQGGRDHFYSAGLEVEYGLVFNPLDAWGIGYASTDLASDAKEHLAELYYNFHLAEKLRISLNLQYVTELRPGLRDSSFLASGLRLQASF